MTLRPDEYRFGNPDAEWDEALVHNYLFESRSFTQAQVHANQGSCWIFSGALGSGKTALRKLMLERLPKKDPRVVLSARNRLDATTIIRTRVPDIALHLRLVLLLLATATLEAQTRRTSLVSGIQDKLGSAASELLRRAREVAASAEVRAGLPGAVDLKLSVGKLFSGSSEQTSLVDDIATTSRALANTLAKTHIVLFLDDIDEMFHGVEPERSDDFVDALLQGSLDIRNEFAPRIDIRLFVKSFVLQRFMDRQPRTNRFATVYRTLAWPLPQLVPLIAARLRHFSRVTYKMDSAVWRVAFEKPVENIQQKLASQATYGPRDMINFCELARQNAQDRGAVKIGSQDVASAEMRHSTGIVKEADEQFSRGDLRPVLERWRGSKRVIEQKRLRDQLNAILEDVNLRQSCPWLGDYTDQTLLRILVNVGFLGFRQQGRMKFTTSDEIQVSTPELYLAGSYEIHPGFAAYLDLT